MRWMRGWHIGTIIHGSRSIRPSLVKARKHLNFEHACRIAGWMLYSSWSWCFDNYTDFKQLKNIMAMQHCWQLKRKWSGLQHTWKLCQEMPAYYPLGNARTTNRVVVLVIHAAVQYAAYIFQSIHVGQANNHRCYGNRKLVKKIPFNLPIVFLEAAVAY